jgi:hypothetical protein
MVRVLCVMILGLILPSATHAVEVAQRHKWGANDAIAHRKPPLPNGVIGRVRFSSENEMPQSEAPVYLTVHHSAFAARKLPFLTNVKEFQALMQKGYDIHIGRKDIENKHVTLGDIPYHYFIGASGEIAAAREEKYAPFSNTKYKTPIAQHRTVVLEGDFTKTYPSDEQMKSLVDLLVLLATQYKIPLSRISYHQAVASNTACPGEKLIERWGSVQAALKAQGIK